MEGSIGSVNLAFEQEYKFNKTEYYYHHAEAALSGNITKWLSLGVSYRQIYELEEKWGLEKNPSLTVSLSQKLGGFSLSDRNKLEIRVYEGKDTIWRYRNKLSLSPPLKLTGLKIGPYIADEILVDEDGLCGNRLSAGIKLSLMKQLEGELFGMIKWSKKDDTWKSINVLGTEIKAVF